MEHYHENKVVHRDLKLDNLLLDCKWNVKIVNFGLSNIILGFMTYCGSPNYFALEVWICGIFV